VFYQSEHGAIKQGRDISDRDLSEAAISAIVEMALSDHVRFANIEREFGLSETQVKALMRGNLKTGSYRAWRKRVRAFSDRREHYK
jgi:uncharacterized protein (TIGR03643 family)